MRALACLWVCLALLLGSAEPTRAAAPKDTIAKLKRWMATMTARRDVVVLRHEVGPPVSATRLRKFKHLPKEVRAFYASFDGLVFEWEFAQSNLPHGKLQVPALAPGTKFSNALGIDFGDPKAKGLLLDSVQPEFRTYLVQGLGPKPTMVIGASGDEPEPLNISFMEYLELGLQSGFAWGFRTLSRPDQTVAGVIKRLATKPLAIRKYPAGTRVVVSTSGGRSYTGESNRGAVERWVKATKPDKRGPDYALVVLDHGPRVWVPLSRMVLPTMDAYEVLRGHAARGPLAGATATSLERFSRLGDTSVTLGLSWRDGKKFTMKRGWLVVHGVLSAQPFPRNISSAVDLLVAWETEPLCKDPSFVHRTPLDGTDYNASGKAAHWWTCAAVRRQIAGAIAASLSQQKAGTATAKAVAPALGRMPARYAKWRASLQDLAMNGGLALRVEVERMMSTTKTSKRLGLDSRYPTLYPSLYPNAY